jgi:anti-anti-sigma factor
MVDAQPAASAQPVVVTLPAAFDMGNADGIYKEITAAFADGPQVVVADMSATTFCDTMGIRTLVLAHRQAAAIGTDLRLVVSSPGVLRIMEVLGVDAMLPIYDSMEEAVAGPGVTT